MGKEGVTRNLPNNAYQAATGANNPDGTNVYATLADLFQQDGLIDGSAVWSGSGFIYDVTNLLYRIGGVLYTATATQVTLTAADPTLDRIDLIVVDTAGVISVKTGVAAPAPVAPPLDVDEVLVAEVFVGAGTTAPVITIEALYDENAGSPTEWIGTSDDGNVTFASVADPNTGTVSIETTLPLGSNKHIQLAKGSPYTIVSGSVDFYIKAKQAMSTSSGQLYIGFYVGGSLVGNSVYIGGSPTNIYGFDPTDTSTYQLVSIPITAFGVLPTTVDAIRFFKGPGSTTAEFFLDGVEIQEGAVAPPVAPSLPSLTNGHIWVGDASNTAVEILLSALEQNLSSVLGVGNLADLDIIIDTLSIGPGGTRQIVSNDGGVTGELTAITFLNLGGAIGDALLLGNPEFLTGPSAVGGLVGIDNFQTKMEYHLSTTTGYYTCVDANGWFFFVQGAITPRDVRFDPQVRLRMDSPDGSGSFARFITNNLTANRTYTFQDGDGTVAFLSDITGGGGGGWQPPHMTLSSWWDSTAARLANANAGFQISFSPSANQDMRCQVSLDKNGVAYDGSNLRLRLHWQLFNSAPGVGDDVLWRVSYVFLLDGDDGDSKAATTVDNVILVESRTQNQLYTDDLNIMTGVANARTLAITLTRQSSGAPPVDSYSDFVDVFGAEIIKA